MPRLPRLAALLLCTGAAWLSMASYATAQSGDCPPIADKPGSTAHVNYPGMQRLTFCSGPISMKPGQNFIRLNGTNLKPSVPGYITRFDPEFVYADGTVPPTDVRHLHHAVWVVAGPGASNGPQFASGEEKTIWQMPQGFGWRSLPSHTWLLSDMLHDLVGAPAKVYIVWRIDFVPDTSPAAASMKTVTTQWMDTAGLNIYPIFDALRSMGTNGTYTFPDQATGKAREDIGASQTWTVPSPRTLIAVNGHLHPGGLYNELRTTRGNQTRSLFKTHANYWEPAGPVSWDVSIGVSPDNWRVRLQTGDKVSVHSTYDTSRADWHEVMGVMAVAVYNGTDAGGVDAMSPSIPQANVLTHGHLAENDNHGGDATGAPDPLQAAGVPVASDQVQINGYAYLADLGEMGSAGFERNPATVLPGQALTFRNLDAGPSRNTFHTITNCAPPCNGKTGIAYPLADGPVSFDSAELGFNGQPGAAPKSLAADPAADRDTWTGPNNLEPGTYTYFCRIHPFMRGSFRVSESTTCHGRKATLVGTPGRDVIRGTDQRDVIVGLGGNDKLIGLGANDFICGGPGRDKIISGKGRDRLWGDAGKDRLLGGGGKDRLLGGKGRDRLRGGTGRDRLAGGQGRDRLVGGKGRDRLAGGQGRDRLVGGKGRDRLAGGAGKDRLAGGPGRDRNRQ